MAPLRPPLLVPQLTTLARGTSDILSRFGAVLLDMPRRLCAIRIPTLLLVGDHDSPVIRVIVDTLGSRIPSSAVVVIRGSGHMVNMERPADFNRVVLHFLLR